MSVQDPAPAPPVAGHLRSHGGDHHPGETWLGPVTDAERRLLTRAARPVLDIGCGPARHAEALAMVGVPALGIDITPGALALARPRGVPVLERDVFRRLPGSGRWGTALLLDGNVGIGGDPRALLCRVATLLRVGGNALVELAAPGTQSRADVVRVEVGGSTGPWFPWAFVDVDVFASIVAGCDALRLVELWTDEGRWFCELAKVLEA